MERSHYLVRHGLTAARIGRFRSAAPYQRGDSVVVRSHRGVELGEVLVPAPANDPQGEGVDEPRILRTAGPADLERNRLAGMSQGDCFTACREVVTGGRWDLEVLDVEPLLEGRRAILYYLAPHPLDDPAGLVAAFRRALDLDVLLESVVDDPEPDTGETADPHADACGGCGSGGKGGCGSGGCGSSSGCGDCGVKKLLASRR